MIILSIETSCDETAVSIVRAEGGADTPLFAILGNALSSQIALHTEYGGVVPNLAKREHGKNLIPLLSQALTDADLLVPAFEKTTEKNSSSFPSTFNKEKVKSILDREGDLGEATVTFLEQYQKPEIDVIAVTAGPGLEPALWVGISLAKALGMAWNVPVVPTNHMRGHIASVLISGTSEVDFKARSSPQPGMKFPALSLLISGGHTELVLARSWSQYEIIGQTRDDAVGEAFDKVARMLSLPYPGGPQISRLATQAKGSAQSGVVSLPRPMIKSDDFDFSFSGLKTAVLYYIRDHGLTEELKPEIAREFEDAVVDVLLAKTRKALDHTGAETLIIAGGVIANTKIRESFQKMMSADYPYISLFIPQKDLATDNAVMIACAAYLDIETHPALLDRKCSNDDTDFRAQGNMSIA